MIKSCAFKKRALLRKTPDICVILGILTGAKLLLLAHFDLTLLLFLSTGRASLIIRALFSY